MKVSYCPTVVNFTSVSHFEIQCRGGNECELQVSGVGESYCTFLSSESLNFGEVKIGGSLSRLLTLHNDSDQPTKYQFHTSATSIFSFSVTTGVVAARSSARIIIHF